MACTLLQYFYVRHALLMCHEAPQSRRAESACTESTTSPQFTAAGSAQVTRILKRSGASASAAQPAAHTGDIVSIAGLSSAAIGDTLCAPEVTERLSPGSIDPPTLSMVFAPNSSPIGRTAGNVVTAARIHDRLVSEAATSVSLQVRLLVFHCALLLPLQALCGYSALQPRTLRCSCACS